MKIVVMFTFVLSAKADADSTTAVVPLRAGGVNDPILGLLFRSQFFQNDCSFYELKQ